MKGIPDAVRSIRYPCRLLRYWFAHELVLDEMKRRGSELLRRWADELDLQTELLSGAFFMRKKGFLLENHHWWLRANLAFGAVFPGWPGELYWAWRKPHPTALPRVDSVASTMEGRT